MDERILETPSFAIENVTKEVVHMGYMALENTQLATKALVELKPEQIAQVIQTEKDINKLEQLITEYLIKINNTSLTEAQQLVITHLFNTVNDIERIGDHASNIAELAEFNIDNKVDFSLIAINELNDMAVYTIDTLRMAIEAREHNDFKLVHKVEDREDKIDTMEEKLRDTHIKRLSNYECSPQSSVVFLDVISHYERISDHALNIATYVQDEVFI
jgi:phosphate:Na+ symporter